MKRFGSCSRRRVLAASAPRRAAAPPPAGKPMRGAFMILTTPFTDAAARCDWDDLAREARFVDQSGAHGHRLAAGIEQRRQPHERRADARPGGAGQGEPGPQDRARPRRAGQEHRRDAGVRAARRSARARRDDRDAAERRRDRSTTIATTFARWPRRPGGRCSCRRAAARESWRRRST